MSLGPQKYVVIDIETTGIEPTNSFITELGAVKVINGEVVATYSQLVNPQVQISEQITKITGIDNQMVANAPTFEEVVESFMEFVEEFPIIGHNVLFDYAFIKYHSTRLGYKFERYGIDTLAIARSCLLDIKSRSLTNLIQYFGIERERAHRAYHDALATQELYEILKIRFHEHNEVLFEIKPLHWRAKKNSPITPRQRDYLIALIRKYNLFEELDVNRLSKSEASQYIDRIRFLKGF